MLSRIKDVPPTMRAFLSLTAWFSLVAPLWFLTIKTHRAGLNYAELERYDTTIHELVKARVPVQLRTNTELGDIVEACQFVLDTKLQQLGVHNWTLAFSPEPDSKLNPETTDDALVVTFKNEKHSGFHLESTGRLLTLNYDLELLTTGHVADMVVDVLLDQVYREEIEQWMGLPPGDMAASFSPQYHIAISVLSGGGDHVPFDSAQFAEKFAGLRGFLHSKVCNITVDSQLDYYARPGTVPTHQKGKYVLDHDSLATFINFAEWNLASTVPYPTLNFILYVPDESQKPLEIQDSKTNSFIVSQWGGVVIQNKVDIDQFYAAFQAQLLTLLGAPTFPASLDLRLDSLARLFSARSVDATASSLGSLDRLAKKMEEIPIPNEVAQNCEAALEGLQQALDAISLGNFAKANKFGGIAYKYAEAAFFDKHMVSQAFFPDEHKLAVYLPLLAPIGLLLFQRWRNIKLFRNSEFRQLLAECDAKASKLKNKVSKKKVE